MRQKHYIPAFGNETKIINLIGCLKLQRIFFLTALTERIVSIGSGRTCGCFTAAFFERNMLYFRRGAVAAQRLGVAMELKEPNQCLPELGGDCRRREKTDNCRGEKAGSTVTKTVKKTVDRSL